MLAPIVTVTGDGWSSRVRVLFPVTGEGWPGRLFLFPVVGRCRDTDNTRGGDISGATSAKDLFRQALSLADGSGVELRENAPES